MFRVVSPPIIRSTQNCMYSVWYGLTSTRRCTYSCVCSWWWVEIPPETCRAVFPEVNKVCYVASCWKYIWTLWIKHIINIEENLLDICILRIWLMNCRRDILKGYSRFWVHMKNVRWYHCTSSQRIDTNDWYHCSRKVNPTDSTKKNLNLEKPILPLLVKKLVAF